MDPLKQKKIKNYISFFSLYFIIIINYNNNYKIILYIIIIIYYYYYYLLIYFFKDTLLYKQYKCEPVKAYITCQLSHTMHWCHACGLKTSLQHIKDDFLCLTHTSWKIVLFPSHMITSNNENSIKSPHQKRKS